MKFIGFLLGLPVFFITWALTASVLQSIAGEVGGEFGKLLIGPLLGLGAWGGIIGCFEYLAANRAENRKQEAERRRRLLSLTNLVTRSAEMVSNLPNRIRDAEHAFDIAEEEFEDGAFAPFWDAIEKATIQLATFNSEIQALISNSEFYKNEAQGLLHPPLPFPLQMRTLPDATRTAERMRRIVRRAQKDFHFATIYEQRKTNQLLVAGFSTLGQAIVELENRLESSLNQLGSSLCDELERSREQRERDTDAQREHERQHLEKLDDIQHQGMRDAEARREHERPQLERLDNIQRQTKPRT